MTYQHCVLESVRFVSKPILPKIFCGTGSAFQSHQLNLIKSVIKWGQVSVRNLGKTSYEFDSSLLFRSKKANMQLLQESNCCQILFFWLLVYLSFESLELIIFISRICSSWQLHETYGNFFYYLHYILKNSDFCHLCAINSRQTFPKFQQNVSHVKYFAWKNYFWVTTAS